MVSSHVIKNSIHWAMFANELGVYAGFLALLGGLLALGDDFEGIEFAYYSIAVSFVIIVIEYPRSKRPKGRTLPRAYQEYLSPIVRGLGAVAHNYFSRCVIWLGISIPMYLCLPTLLGGVTLTLSALVYFLSALKGERWLYMSAVSKQHQKVGGKMMAAPTRAPPRRPTNIASGDKYKEETKTTTSQFVNKSSAHIANPVLNRPTVDPRKSYLDSMQKNHPQHDFTNYEWEHATDDVSGDVYYINGKTDETSWEKPPLWDEFVAYHNGNPPQSFA
eukprot:m.133084 g.133084  ORF g.133084 m.133084 type:complete len:275 (-) comp9491_c0_seq3:5732-6556(-)